MRKLFSTLAVVLVFAMAFTITASANTDTVYPLGSDGYSITCTDDSIKAGDMVGMVVIGAANPNYKVIDENTIRYIDQTTAGTDGSISFPSFKPMDLKTDETMYLVYIGGGELQEATKIGKLASASEDPTPTTYDVIFMADGVQVAKITKNVDETLAFADFPNVPAKTGYTGVWNVTTDITSATTVTAVYTEDSTGDDDDDTTVLYGDVNGDNKVNNTDGGILIRHLADWEDYPLSVINQANADVNTDGKLNNQDGGILIRHLADWEDYLTLPYTK